MSLPAIYEPVLESPFVNPAVCILKHVASIYFIFLFLKIFSSVLVQLQPTSLVMLAYIAKTPAPGSCTTTNINSIVMFLSSVKIHIVSM